MTEQASQKTEVTEEVKRKIGLLPASEATQENVQIIFSRSQECKELAERIDGSVPATQYSQESVNNHISSRLNHILALKIQKSSI